MPIARTRSSSSDKHQHQPMHQPIHHLRSKHDEIPPTNKNNKLPSRSRSSNNCNIPASPAKSKDKHKAQRWMLCLACLGLAAWVASVTVSDYIILPHSVGSQPQLLTVGINNKQPFTSNGHLRAQQQTPPVRINRSKNALSPDRMWRPHSSIKATPEGLLVVPPEEGLFAGTYQFQHAPWCKDDSKRDSTKCAITFPLEGTSVCNTASSCLVTRAGSKGHLAPNQDRTVLIESSDSKNSANDNWFFAGLFDGHGELGHAASEIAVQELPVALLLNQKQQQHAPAMAKMTLDPEAFLTVDAGALADLAHAGTTAIAVLQSGTAVHMASVGDSTAWLVQWLGGSGDDSGATTDNPYYEKPVQRQRRGLFGLRGLVPALGGDSKQLTAAAAAGGGSSSPNYKVLLSAVQHKPGDPKERARIEANGGSVYVPRDPSRETSRVFYSQEGAPGGQIFQMALAMSRSLGDIDGKKQKVVIAEPDIDSIDLQQHLQNTAAAAADGGNGSSAANQQQFFFVVLASDGVVDFLDRDEVILPLGRALQRADDASNKDGSLLYEACEGILDEAAARWGARTGYQYRDDMSLTVKRLRF